MNSNPQNTGKLLPENRGGNLAIKVPNIVPENLPKLKEHKYDKYEK